MRHCSKQQCCTQSICWCEQSRIAACLLATGCQDGRVVYTPNHSTSKTTQCMKGNLTGQRLVRKLYKQQPRLLLLPIHQLDTPRPVSASAGQTEIACSLRGNPSQWQYCAQMPSYVLAKPADGNTVVSWTTACKSHKGAVMMLCMMRRPEQPEQYLHIQSTRYLFHLLISQQIW